MLYVRGSVLREIADNKSFQRLLNRLELDTDWNSKTCQLKKYSESFQTIFNCTKTDNIDFDLFLTRLYHGTMIIFNSISPHLSTSQLN